LAQMYLAGGDWIKAGAVFRSLVATYDSEPRWMVAYITALLDHGETSTAEIYLDRLEKLYGNHIVTVGVRAEMLVAKNESPKALELLRAFIDKPDAQPPERTVRMRLVAEKLEDLGQKLKQRNQKTAAKLLTQQAEAFYRAYVEQQLGQDWVLAKFLALQGQFDEALDLLERSWDTTNPLVLSQVCDIFVQNNNATKEQVRRLDRILQAALTKFDRPVPLLMTMAEACGRQGRCADAESCYIEVLQKNGGNAAAMNNLAVLLALQGVKLDEAKKLIDKAIEIAGPMGAMLDSRASVHMAAGQPDKAIDDMADALADAETPVRLFHQAQAYDQAGKRSAAAAAMESALKKGLTKESVHPLELKTFDKLSKLRP
jgi:cellulose synthase operon protein C